MPEPSPDAAESGSPPEVSIIVVSWNAREVLRGCLASIEAETRLPHEVIVIDNASSDGSADMVRAEFPEVLLIANETNRGFASANNQGLRLARGRSLLLLNPDTVVLDGAIDHMAAWLDAHPDVGCVGCQVRETPRIVQLTSFADLTPANQAIVELGLARLAGLWPRLGRPDYRGWDRTTARKVDVVSGMFMMLPRRVFEAVGPMDEAFFIYAEEADWCRRIRAGGWICAFEPSACILHLDGGGKSTAQVRPAMHVEMQRSKLLYARKHHGAGWATALQALYLASALTRLLVFGPLGALGAGATARARARLARAALVFHLTGRGALVAG